MKKILLLMKSRHKLRDTLAYFVGNYRHRLYYRYKKRFLRKHIIEQFEWRVLVMDKQCYNSGSCKMCGCQTTNLQMAHKGCEGHCYPPMMNKKHWEIFKLTIPCSVQQELNWEQ